MREELFPEMESLNLMRKGLDPEMEGLEGLEELFLELELLKREELCPETPCYLGPTSQNYKQRPMSLFISMGDFNFFQK